MTEWLAKVELGLGMPLPSELKDLYEERDGYFDEAGQWWVVWPLDRLIAENRHAHSLGLPEDLIAFGDDGTGNPFCVRSGDESAEVVRWSWIDGEVESSEGSVRDFATSWCSDNP